MTIYFYDQWYDCLNNFSAHAVEIDGVIYPTAEHAYQAAKCMDPAGKAEILACRSPLATKDISNNKHKKAKLRNWDEVKVDVIEQILRAKLEQHSEVKAALIKSGNQEIAENSPIDYFWGRGKDGSGRNELGKLWMKLRAELVDK